MEMSLLVVVLLVLSLEGLGPFVWEMVGDDFVVVEVLVSSAELSLHLVKQLSCQYEESSMLIRGE